MKKVLLLTVLLCLAILYASAADDLAFRSVPESFSPGRLERISYSVAESGQISLTLKDPAGNTVYRILQDYQVAAGTHHLTWDCMDQDGNEIPKGTYYLVLTQAENEISASVSVMDPIPKIIRLRFPDIVTAGEDAVMTLEATRNGLFSLIALNAPDKIVLIADQPVGEGENLINVFIPGDIVPGNVTLEAVIRSPEGVEGTNRQLMIAVEAKPTPSPIPTPVPTATPYIPSRAVEIEDEPLNYWTLPIGDPEAEEAIWEVMTQPITVIDGKDQRDVYRLRKEPDKSTAKDNIVGEITFLSQGVHVLETRDDGWSLVEAYNSSYGPDCASRRGYGKTDELIQGYVQTSLLKVINPVTQYGLLIDKMTQTMYIFSDGQCIGTLLVSTGEPTKKQPWNETPSGEFLLVSFTGGFPAGNLWCDYGMRINGGCLIHEVPYIGNEDTPSDRRDYSSTVPKLGSKASHGCIRVQKKENEQGQNIKWLWKNLKLNTKVLIWDDTGRWIPYPDDSTVVYYNPTGGKYFHQNQYCPYVKDRYLPLTETTYGELENLFETPIACTHCATLKTKAEIDALNAAINPDPQ